MTERGAGVGGDEGRSGVLPVSGVPERPVISWTARTRGSVVASPVLTGEGTLVATDSTGTVYAFDATTGRQHWSYAHDVDAQVEMPVAVWGDLLFVGVADVEPFYDGDLFLHVHDLKTGELLRSIEGAWFPAVTGDVLLIHDLAECQALALPDLSRLWRVKSMNGWMRTAPAFGAGMGHAGGGFEANRVSPGIDTFQLRSGRPVRKRSGYIELEPDSLTNAMPLPAHAVFAEGLVWLPIEWGDDWSNGGIVGLDPRSGEVRVRHLIEDRHVVGTVAVCDGVLHFADTPSGGGTPPLAWTATALNAVQVADGRSRWTFPFRPIGTPVLADGVVYAASSKGAVVALDAVSGEPQWTLELDSPVETLYDLTDFNDEQFFYEPAPPVLPADGLLYIRTETGVTALRRDNG